MFVAVGQQFFDEKNYSTWNLSYGDGNAENLTALACNNTNATLTTSGEIETSKAANVVLEYAHKLTPELATKLAFN